MTLKAKVANALSFAQMAGLGRSKAAKAEEEEDKKKDEAKAEDDDEEAKARAEADDEKKDDDSDEKKESKKAKAESEEDEDDEKKESAKAKAAVAAHNERCKAIVAHGVKTGQVVHACAYAFDTGLSAEAAIATLDANLELQPSKAATASLAERMASVQTPVVQSEAEGPAAGSAAAVAQMVIAAAAKARGEKI